AFATARGDRPPRKGRGNVRTPTGSAREAGASGKPHQALPLYRPHRSALPPLRARIAARRAGGHVLPDGRVRFHDRTHEGPRLTLLHAALYLPDAALQARGD